MKQFNANRFGTLLKCHLREQRSHTLRYSLMLFLVLFSMDVLLTRTLSLHVLDEADYASAVYNTMGSQLIVLWSVFLAGASILTEHIKDQRQRVTFLMLPASNLEKYFVRLLYGSVLLPLLAVGAMVLADLLRMLLASAFGHPTLSGVAWLLSDSNGSEASDGSSVVWWLSVGMILVSHATYTLGGAVFRGKSFLWTSFILMVLFVVSVQALSYTGFLRNFPFVTYHPGQGLTLHPMFVPITVVCYVLAALFYWLSYRVFCRTQLVTRKYLNL